jgi:ribonucleoside-diphosphate reductase alpha subunit
VKVCLDDIRETYDMMSRHQFTHATPTLFNAGTRDAQLSSCFLMGCDDSIRGIYKLLSDCADIQKKAGGIGIHISNIRAKGSLIRGTSGGGISNGVVPMLKVFDSSSCYVDQGGGKRPGSIAVYIEPHHADIMEVIDLRLPHGNEQSRARNLFYAMWLSDLFMERCDKNAQWSLFCPDECKGLSDVYGDEYRALYERYESEGRARRVLPARDIMAKIIKTQVETGLPYICYKDTINRRSNQMNIGVIKSSNLCAEITLVSSHQEYSVCNLSSLCLPALLRREGDNPIPVVDYDLLRRCVRRMVRNLNRIIDINYYTCGETKRTNDANRPIGIGVQGLADLFIQMRVPFGSDAAAKINSHVAEAMYYWALDASCELAATDGPYQTFAGSPASRGQLQFDLAGFTPETFPHGSIMGADAWAALKARIVAQGLRNSTLIALMPTASTSQIMGYNECIEPYMYNMYVRRTKAGSFVHINQQMMTELIARGLWTTAVRKQIEAEKGSLQNIAIIPAEVKELFKTSMEIKTSVLIKLAAERGIFICQSQSFNVFLDTSHPKIEQILTNIHMLSWRSGLKTGMYYLRQKAAIDAQQFKIEDDSTLLTETTMREVVEPVAAASADGAVPAVAPTPTAGGKKKRVVPKECVGDESCLMCSA